MTYLVNYADNHVQILPSRKITLKQEIRKLDEEIHDKQSYRDFFDDTSSSDSGASAIKILKLNIRNWRGGLVNTVEDPSSLATLQSQIDVAEKELESLETERKEMSKAIDGLKKKRVSVFGIRNHLLSILVLTHSP